MGAFGAFRFLILRRYSKSTDSWREGFQRIWRAPAPKPSSADAGHWADDQLFAEWDKAGIEKSSVILLVGHETRLSQLILRFTGERRRQLEALEAVCISAPDLKELQLGHGKVIWRYPVRNWLDGELTAKIASKMAVATFLASANFIGMMELLTASRELLLNPKPILISPWPWHCNQIIRAISCEYLLTVEKSIPGFVLFWAALVAGLLAAGLFIATVYLYDRLTMPSGFWLLKPPRRREEPLTLTPLALGKVARPLAFGVALRGLLAWLRPDTMVERLDEMIDALPDGAMTTADQEMESWPS